MVTARMRNILNQVLVYNNDEHRMHSKIYCEPEAGSWLHKTHVVLGLHEELGIPRIEWVGKNEVEAKAMMESNDIDYTIITSTAKPTTLEDCIALGEEDYTFNVLQHIAGGKMEALRLVSTHQALLHRVRLPTPDGEVEHCLLECNGHYIDNNMKQWRPPEYMTHYSNIKFCRTYTMAEIIWALVKSWFK